MFSKTLTLLALSALASAQYGDSKLAATSAGSAAPGATAVVQVGNKGGELIFTPSEIAAEQGSFVEFKFWPQNHSVAQSSFGNPCQPLIGDSTIFSGFHAVAADATEKPTYIIQINSTSPIWLYCSQGKHCQNGMVAVINAPASGARTLAAYKAAAAEAQSNVSPRLVFGGVVGSSKATSAPGPSTTPNVGSANNVRWAAAAVGALAVGAFMA